MDRRRFLGTIAAGATVVSTAGCLGYTLKSTDEIDQLERTNDQLQQRLENKSQRVEELDSEITELEEQVQSLEESTEEKQSEIDTLEEDLDAAKSKQVLYLYGYGVTHYNNGVDYFNRATNRDNDQYDAIRADLNVAGGHFDSAAANFGGAVERAGEIGADQVEEWSSDAETKASAFFSAVSDYQVAMAHYSEGQDSQAEDKISDGDEHYSTVQEYEIKDRSDLEDELGASI